MRCLAFSRVWTKVRIVFANLLCPNGVGIEQCFCRHGVLERIVIQRALVFIVFLMVCTCGYNLTILVSIP